MRRARAEQGAIERYGIGRTLRTATITCCHCNTVVEIAEGARAEDCGGFCFKCMQPTCGPCADKGCTPFEAVLEQMERSSAQRRRLLDACGIRNE